MARRYRCSACGEEDVSANLTWCSVAAEDFEHRYEREHCVPAHAERILPRPLSVLRRFFPAAKPAPEKDPS